MGIGGEYAAINSAIDELIPAKYRCRADIAVNGTYWGGAFLGTIVRFFSLSTIWRRVTRGVWPSSPGPLLGIIILFIRKNLA